MSNIRAIKAREVLDSQGFPTVQLLMWIDDGRSVVVTVPNEWAYENIEAKIIRDNDDQEFNGKGVKTVIESINKVIAPRLLGMPVISQGEIDKALIEIDGTADKSKYGANAILAISMATLKAGALSTNLPLYSYIQQKYQLTEFLTIPNCVYPLITGGDFGNDNIDFQEFELIPASHVSFNRSLTMASTIREKIQDVIESRGGSVCTGPTGGFLPRMNSNAEVFELFLEAIKTTQYTFAQDIFFGLDVAADTLVADDNYKLRDKPDRYSAKDMAEYYKSLRERYKTIYLEDPFSSKDERSWQQITEKIGTTTKIVADEFVLSNHDKLKKAIKNKTANAICLKLLDRGTISESLQLIKIAKEAEWTVVIGEHSGETNETFLADLAVGAGADYAKLGPPNQGERVAKYNRLIEINEEINPENNSG